MGISKIERKRDNKIFSCYFKTGEIIKNKRLKKPSWWISEDGEEITLNYLDTDDFKVIRPRS